MTTNTSKVRLSDWLFSICSGQPKLDGENKKALYLQANNRASKTVLDG